MAVPAVTARPAEIAAMEVTVMATVVMASVVITTTPNMMGEVASADEPIHHEGQAGYCSISGFA